MKCINEKNMKHELKYWVIILTLLLKICLWVSVADRLFRWPYDLRLLMFIPLVLSIPLEQQFSTFLSREPGLL